VDGRKLAGVLIGGRPGDGDEGWAVIGIGLNVSVPPDSFPPELRETAASLGEEVTVAAALEALNRGLSRWVDAEEAEILDAFRARDGLRGRPISWDGGAGIAAGIDDDGHLVVDVEDGESIALGAGEVHLAVEG
jgi:BirA family biotin operon repressor/biotin-[acetyl-CoA-carboxylase] ligase